MKTIKFNAAEWHAAMIREHYESIGEKSSLKYRLLCNVEFVIGRLYEWLYVFGFATHILSFKA